LQNYVINQKEEMMMHIVYVTFDVKPECIERFMEISAENASNSLKEEGVIAFDVIQQYDDGSRFAFHEVYKVPEDHMKHRETAHFKKWKSEVDSLTRVPYSAIKYHTI
jgi:(4S)-4-hydroxy-5-phosphonooxypentane-2,3-dione isomerase